MDGAGRAVGCRPRPGTGYLALLAGMAALGFLTCGLAVPEHRGAGRIEWIAAIIVVISVGGLIVATVDAAFRTRYEIFDRELRLRSGFVMRAVSPIATWRPWSGWASSRASSAGVGVEGSRIA